MAFPPEAERPFVGRLEAVEALRRRSEDARAGHGGVTLLIGETGVGKSTLIAEMVRRCRESGIQVLSGRAPALENPPPFIVVRQALEGARPLRQTTGRDSGAPSPEAFVPTGKDGVLIGFAPRLGVSATEEPVAVEERLLDALTQAEEQTDVDRGRLFAWLAEQFLALTKRGPTALIIDDLHLADESSLECIAYLASQLQDQPLWILASVLAPSSLREARRAEIEQLERGTRAHRVVLQSFTPAEVSQFVQLLEPERNATNEQVARWHSETGGNPLFLEQILRTRPEGKGPEGRPAPSVSASELPQYLQQTVERLDDEELRVAAVASVLGKELSFQLLLKASGEEEEQLAEVTDRLVGHGVLRELPDERLSFVGDELRNRIYSGLTETRRRVLHRRAGEAIESTGTADVATVYALARHFYLGKVDEKAEAYNHTAADFAIKSFASSSAREHLERALECHRRAFPKDVVGEIELTLALALQLDHLGELKPAEDLLREVLARRSHRQGATGQQRTLVRLYLTRVLTDRGEWKEAERMTAELLPEVEPSNPLTRIALHRLRGEALYYLGRYPEALSEHDAALGLARDHEFEREIALELVRRGNVLAMMPGHSAEAIDSVRHASESLVRLGDNAEAAYSLLFLGVMLSQEHRNEEAAAVLRRAVALGEEAKNLRRVGWSLFNLADILRESNQLDEARIQNRRSRQILEQIGDRFGLVQTMIVQGKILLDTGELDAAEVELLDAYRLVRELKTPADEVDVVLRLAYLALARGDRSAAQRRVEELERQGLTRLRPDIEPEFARLKSALEGSKGSNRATAA